MKFILPGAIFLGIIGGLLGPLFININTRTNAIRAKCLKKKWFKPIETFFFRTDICNEVNKVIWSQDAFSLEIQSSPGGKPIWFASSKKAVS